MSSLNPVSQSYSPALPLGMVRAGQAMARLVRQFHAVLTGTAHPSRPLGRTAQAARVREMAFARLHDDPRFAQDLYAAADRHEAAESA